MKPVIRNSMKNPGMHLMYLLLVIVIANSCSKDEGEPLNPEPPDCCDLEYIGDYTLMPSSRESIPYQSDANLIFKDDENNEITLTFREELNGLESTDNATTRACPCNPDFNQMIKAKGEAYSYFLTEPLETLNMRFLIALSIQPFYGEDMLTADILTVSLSDEQDNSSYSGLFNVLVDRRDLTDDFVSWYQTSPVDSIQILSKTFYNVFSDETGNTWYNCENGLVAFKDRNETLWALDRVEAVK